MSCTTGGQLNMFHFYSLGCEKSELLKDARTPAATIEGKEYNV